MMVTGVMRLRRQWGRWVRAVVEENRPVLVTRRGQRVAVMLPYQTFERLLPLLVEEWGDATPYTVEETVPM